MSEQELEKIFGKIYHAGYEYMRKHPDSHKVYNPDNVNEIENLKSELRGILKSREQAAEIRGMERINEAYFTLGNKIATPEWQKLDQMRALYENTKIEIRKAKERLKGEVGR